MQAEEKLRRAFDLIYDEHPFLANIVASWNVVETTRVPTGYTNGPEMGWNRKFIDTCTITDTARFILHEAGHIFLGHHLRSKGIHAKEWNVAADLALNWHIIQYLDGSGKIGDVQICIPGRGQFSHLEGDHEAEWYYNKLHQPPQEQPKSEPKKSEKQDKGDEGEDEQESEGSSEGSEDESDDEQDGEGESKPEEDEQESEDGSGNSQEASEGEESEDEGSESSGGDQGQQEPQSGLDYSRDDLPDSLGEIEPYPGDESPEEAEEKWQEIVAQGINNAMQHGNMPGFLKEIVEKMYGEKSSTDWKSKLRRFATKWATARFTFNKPNRRHSWRKDLIMPARKSRDASPGLFFCDTSGSVDQDQLNAFMRELEGAFKAYPEVEITMVQCDTEIKENGVKVFTKHNFPMELPDHWLGRGGTDPGPSMKKMVQEGHGKYKWMVVCTDGYFHMDQVENPGIPVLWVLTREPYAGYGRPKFGEVIGPIPVTSK